MSLHLEEFTRAGVQDPKEFHDLKVAALLLYQGNGLSICILVSTDHLSLVSAGADTVRL